MEHCARVETARFELVASINRRIAQWAEPLFLKPVRFKVQEVWSTASKVKIPPIPSVGDKLPHDPVTVAPTTPGTTPMSLIQAMDDDLLVVHLTNISHVMDGLGPPPGFRLPNEQRHFLMVLSTALVSCLPHINCVASR